MIEKVGGGTSVAPGVLTPGFHRVPIEFRGIFNVGQPTIFVAI